MSNLTRLGPHSRDAVPAGPSSDLPPTTAPAITNDVGMASQHPLQPSLPINRPLDSNPPNPSAAPAPGPEQAQINNASLKPNACISCQKRKVKCDRVEPCSSCRRYRAACLYREPAPRRKRKLSDEDLHAKLDHYEHLLTQFGARVDAKSPSAKPTATPTTSNQPWAPGFTPLNARDQPTPRDPAAGPPSRESPATAPKPADTGRLVFEKGSSRYLESNLWKGIHDEIRDPRQLLHDHPSPQNGPSAANQFDPYSLDEGQLILGLMHGQNLDLRTLHPQPHHIFSLWQAYLDNVNPLVKLLHAPSVQRQVLKAVSNPETIDAETELLMFSIYLMAVVSMSAEECQATLQESKHRLLTKFQHATKVALHKAGFLRSSDLVVLQAFILFLLAMRPYYDIHTQWSLTAIAIRMSQRIGLHKDGSKLGIPLFDIEMRRRVWWQLTPLEVRTSELAGGSISPLLHTSWDTDLPLNVNDSELNPDMKQLPVEHNGPTEMFFCLLRYNMGHFMRRHRHYFFTDCARSDGEASMADRDRAIDEFEQMLETKFLRHCDPSVPLHYLTAIVARCALCVVRLLAHHPRQYSDKGKSLTQQEKDLLFATSLKTIELDNLAHGDPSLQKFMWHVDAYYQWDALIYLLMALRFRPWIDDKEIEKAWHQVNKTLEYHSQIVSDPNNPLHIAVCNLVAKAWDSYASEHARQNRPPPPIDDLKAVSVLASRAKAKSVTESRGASGGPAEAEGNGRNGEAYQTAQPQQQQQTPPVSASGWNTPLNTTDSSPIDWDVWDGLLQEFGVQAGGFAVDLVG
ncbi:fungal-specific transcription factor domain-containing protein [Phyllosticta capitalensis]